MSARTVLGVALAAAASIGWSAGGAGLPSAKERLEAERLRAAPAGNPRSPGGGAEALSCPTPCTTGTTASVLPDHEAYLSCTTGAPTAETGARNPVTAALGRQALLYRGLGVAASASTSVIGFRFHDNGTEFIDEIGAAACPFDPPDTPSEPQSAGLEAEWTHDPGIAGVQPLVLRHEVVAFGTGSGDDGVRLTLAVTNPAGSSASVSIGLRWELDHYHGDGQDFNDDDDGPGLGVIRCEPFTVAPDLLTEHELAPAEIGDFYRTRNNTGTDVYDVVVSTRALPGFPGTGVPERLVYGDYFRLRSAAWDYVAMEGDTDPDADSAVLYGFGHAPASGIAVAPGETARRSLLLYAVEAVDGCRWLSAPRCLVGNLAAVRQLKGVKAGSGARFEWQPDPAAAEYHLNAVTAKTELRDPEAHEPNATIECFALAPVTTCSDGDAIAGPTLFYQLFSACGRSGAEEGPL